MARLRSDRSAAIAESSFLKVLPAEIRNRIYAAYFASYIISCANYPNLGSRTYLYNSNPQPIWPPDPEGVLYRMGFFRKRMAPAEYDKQPYMVYSDSLEVTDQSTGEYLVSAPISSLLCVCRQVHLEAVPFIIANLHFSFYDPWVLLEALTTQPRSNGQAWVIPHFLKKKRHFDNITSLQICFEKNTIAEVSIADTRSLGNALSTRMPNLQRLLIDVHLSSVIRSPSCLPKPWLAELLWPIRVRRLCTIDSVEPWDHTKDDEHQLVRHLYKELLVKHYPSPAVPMVTGNTNPTAIVTRGVGCRLGRDEDDGSVLHRAVIDAMLREVARYPGLMILKYCLSKAKELYQEALGEWVPSKMRPQ